MYMYQGLGQMLTKRLRHHQGCLETPKCAYVIYGQPLNIENAWIETQEIQMYQQVYFEDIVILLWKMVRTLHSSVGKYPSQFPAPSYTTETPT